MKRAPVLQAKQGKGQPLLSPEATERKRARNREYMARKQKTRTPEEKARLREYQRTYRAENPDKVREWNKRHNLRGKYGLSEQEFHEMLIAQDGLCGVCYSEPATDIDHDHEEGTVRGLLCNPCNLALGLFRDDIERLNGAVLYLKGE